MGWDIGTHQFLVTFSLNKYILWSSQFDTDISIKIVGCKQLHGITGRIKNTTVMVLMGDCELLYRVKAGVKVVKGFR